jgi:hypothetical protein
MNEPILLQSDEPLELTIEQFKQLQLHWFAIGELSEMVDAPDSTGGGLACLKIVEFHLARLMAELQAQIDNRKR